MLSTREAGRKWAEAKVGGRRKEPRERGGSAACTACAQLHTASGASPSPHSARQPSVSPVRMHGASPCSAARCTTTVSCACGARVPPPSPSADHGTRAGCGSRYASVTTPPPPLVTAPSASSTSSQPTRQPYSPPAPPVASSRLSWLQLTTCCGRASAACSSGCAVESCERRSEPSASPSDASRSQPPTAWLCEKASACTPPLCPGSRTPSRGAAPERSHTAIGASPPAPTATSARSSEPASVEISPPPARSGCWRGPPGAA